ncbi:Neprilysin-11 [Hypsibius exemplaris]|uniref:Neprilysin-11 n=1 Tax=Hypsibius exemplaris TaxID=2072580 RepID=A0A1W0WKB0_HYPEX|nr:Neprilysin-11 [Hypsibius exemplaris]
MADFGEIIDKFIAILLAIFEALSPDLVSRNVNSVENSFSGFGDFPSTTARWTTFTTSTFSSSSTEAPLTFVALLNGTRFPDFSANVCQSDFCRDYADSATFTLNTDVDPCDDFYAFACTGTSKITSSDDRRENVDQRPVETGRNGLSSVPTQLRNRTFTRLRGLLESNAPTESQSASKARQIYKACLNSGPGSEPANVDSLRLILSQVIGGWPLITPTWNASAFDLYRSLATAKSLGFDALFQWGVAENPDDPSRNTINLGEAVLGLASPDFYNSDSAASIRQAYRELIGNVASLLVGDNSTVNTLDVRDLVDLETKLANETSIAVNSTTKNLMSISAFIRQYEPTSRLGRELLNLFKTVLKGVRLDNSLTASSVINVENPTFFQLLGSQLGTVERLGVDGKRVLANYIGWNIVFTQLPLLGSAYRRALQTFATSAGVIVELDGTGGLGKPKWQECVEFVNGKMGNAVGALYVREFVPPEAKAKVMDIIAMVKNAALQYVTGATWLDLPDKTAAIEKLQAVVDYVGYPDFIVDNITLLDAYYDEISVADSHFDNMQKLSRFALHQQLRKLGGQNGRNIDNDTSPATVNAFYYYDKNLIALFAGLMQQPFFNMDAPDYVNYAGIGYLYAHEVTYVFQEKGSKSNGSGLPVAGWSATTLNAYRALVNSLRSQYRTFPPTRTLLPTVSPEDSDLVADNLALQFVLTAYRSNHTTPEQALPKLEQFSADMQLLLSFAHNWCEASAESTKGSLRSSASLSLQTYSKRLRVDIPLVNLPDFSDIYKCDLNSQIGSSRKVLL